MGGRLGLGGCDPVRPAADPALCLTCAEPSTAADARQRPLCSRCQARLSRSVAMTSNVKSWEQLFSSHHNMFWPRCIGRGGASKRRRLILLLSVGWLPPSLPPSGACLALGTRILLPASERCRGFHHTGAAPLLMHVGNLLRCGCSGERSLRLMLQPATVWR